MAVPSTYPDNFELWENEIAFIMRPIVDHPADIEMVEGATVTLNWTIDALEDYYFVYSVNGTVDTIGSSSIPVFGADLSLFEPGIYELTLNVRNQFYVGTTDTVWLNVTAIPGGGLPIPLLVAAGVGIAVVAVVVVLLYSKRKPKE